MLASFEQTLSAKSMMDMFITRLVHVYWH
jgi:hypothetical protein